MNGVNHISSFSSSNGADYPTEFTFVPRPMEPTDLDKPVRCPPPEPCIVHVRTCTTIVSLIILSFYIGFLTLSPKYLPRFPICFLTSE